MIVTVDVLFKIKVTAAAQAKPLSKSSQMFQVVFSGAMPLVPSVGIALLGKEGKRGR